jgi:DUF4097 and DUF4098 domain-containing protein YvlB
MRTPRLYLAALALLAGSCAMPERHSTTVTRSWPAAEVDIVQLIETNGSVTVEADSPNEVKLVARVRSYSRRARKNDPNQGFFETELSGGALRISQRRKHFGFTFFGSHTQIDYELRVPPAVALELKTVNGRITTRGTEGEAELITVNGLIDAETSGVHELTAKAVNGTVRAKFLRDFNGAHLKTVNGKVEAMLPQTASFTCNLSQVNGDFEASFPLSIHSNPGSRRVSGEVNGGKYELQITTVNGDVEVQHLPQPKS